MSSEVVEITVRISTYDRIDGDSVSAHTERVPIDPKDVNYTTLGRALGYTIAFTCLTHPGFSTEALGTLIARAIDGMDAETNFQEEEKEALQQLDQAANRLMEVCEKDHEAMRKAFEKA